MLFKPEVRIFVASPSDAFKYHDCLNGVIDLWNEINSRDYRSRIISCNWESATHQFTRESPAPQTTINDLIDSADVLVVVFSKSLGEQNTVSEIDRVFARGKPIIVFKDSEEPDYELEKYTKTLEAKGALFSRFHGMEHLALRSYRDLNRTFIKYFFGDLTFVRRGETDPRAIPEFLGTLVEGDRLTIVGRTCYYWLAKPMARSAVKAALDIGVSLTFVMQDLYDELAKPEFAKLRRQQKEAEDEFDKLWKVMPEHRRPQLRLKYCTVSIPNSRTLLYRSGRFHSLRYDLTMAEGPKPYVRFDESELCEPIVTETLKIESEAQSREDFALTRDRRRTEEHLRIALADAQVQHPFSSKLRWNSPQRLVRHAARIDLARERPDIPPPLSVQLLLTKECSTHCAMCNYFEMKGIPTKALTSEKFRELLDEIARMGTRAVIFSGGEPLLFAGVEDLLSYCWTKGLKVGLLTSGMVGKKNQSTLMHAIAQYCDWIQVSVDSFESQQYRGIRAIDDTKSVALDRCRDFLFELVKTTPAQNVEVCYTIQKKNIRDLEDMKTLRDRIDGIVPVGVPVRLKGPRTNKFTFLKDPLCSSSPAEPCDA